VHNEFCARVLAGSISKVVNKSRFRYRIRSQEGGILGYPPPEEILQYIISLRSSGIALPQLKCD
jgi:hypothetical protein